MNSFSATMAVKACRLRKRVPGRSVLTLKPPPGARCRLNSIERYAGSPAVLLLQPVSASIFFPSKIAGRLHFSMALICEAENGSSPHMDMHWNTCEELWNAFKSYFHRAVKVLTLTNNIQHDAWRKIAPSLVNSMLKPDCLKNGKDIGQMGSRFNTTFNVESCGTANLVTSLASLKKNVYDDKKYSLAEFRNAIIANFGFKTARETGSFSLLDQVATGEYHKWKQNHGAALRRTQVWQ